MIERRNRLLGRAYQLFYERPVHIVKGKGVWLTDADGNRYLDVYNNVPHVGHCHPHVVEAICKQVQTLNTHTRYLHETVLEYAEMLTAKFPVGMDIAMFACTGTEANELALRIARASTGGNGFIATENAYHGNSWAIDQITTSSQSHLTREDNVVTVPAPDVYRGLYSGEEAGMKYAAHLVEAVGTLRQRGYQPAAFIVDTIFCSDGLPRAPHDYLGHALEIVHRAGGVFVADEVQAGFGRTGTKFWGYQNHGVVPDIVTMGKPMANGHPVSAVVTSAGVVDSFREKSHYFNTFGGNPVSCAAAKAVLEVIEHEDLQANALNVGRHLQDGLAGLAKRHRIIGDVRGSGLFIGVELVQDRETRVPAADEARWMINDLRDQGVLIGETGAADNVLKIRPPMVFNRSHADLLLDRLDQSFTRLNDRDL